MTDAINDAALQASFDQLSQKDKQELQQWIVAEAQKSQIQGAVHNITHTCFKKCVTSKISSPGLDRYEEPCMRNCVDRFMDAQNSVLQNLQKVQSGH